MSAADTVLRLVRDRIEAVRVRLDVLAEGRLGELTLGAAAMVVHVNGLVRDALEALAKLREDQDQGAEGVADLPPLVELGCMPPPSERDLFKAVRTWQATRAAALKVTQAESDARGIDDAYSAACEALAELASRFIGDIEAVAPRRAARVRRRCPKCDRISFNFERCQYLDCGYQPTEIVGDSEGES